MKSENDNKRLESLDALRGFDMFFIMGGAELLAALARWFPCGFTEVLARQMEHMDWHGLAFYDMIFPLFLFIAGVSFPFSLASQQAKGRSSWEIHRKVILRGLVLVVLGILYNGLMDRWDFSHARYASVLGRIGLAWMFAALIFLHARWRARVLITAAILVGYWLLLRFVPAPDGRGADVFSARGSIAGYVDRMFLPGKLFYGKFDPEGILGTLPAIATALLGMFTGEWVKLERKGLTAGRKTLWMTVAGVVIMGIGIWWSRYFPLNKNLWTSSFVLVVGGYSLLIFTLFYYLIEIKGWRRWTPFFTVIGMNAITIYLGQVFIRFGYTSHRLFGGLIALLPNQAQPFFNCAAYILVCWLFLFVLYKKKIFLKV